MPPVALPNPDLPQRSPAVPVFPDLCFATPWRRLEWFGLAPSGRLSLATGDPASEQGLVLTAGSVRVRSRDAAADLEAHIAAAPGWMAGRLGDAPEAINPGSAPARVLRLEVAAPVAPHRGVAVGMFDRQQLAWRDAIHGGAGRVATRHVLPSEYFAGPWTFFDHAILAPDSSLGYHYHDALEEGFVVLKGRGYLTVAERTWEVAPGTVTFQHIGEPHGLYCPGPESLEFVRIAVALPDEEYTTVDLHDDLRARRP